MPFGEIEENGKVLIEGKGLTSISLDGFKEVHINGLKSIDVEGDVFSICTIPAVVLLKIIAFDDRSEQRLKDPLDISSIFKVYPDIESEFIWDEYSFLYEDELSHESVGVKVLGFEVRKIVSNSNELCDRIDKILEEAISGKSNLAPYMIADPENETVELIVDKLVLFKSGFNNQQ